VIKSEDLEGDNPVGICGIVTSCILVALDNEVLTEGLDTFSAVETPTAMTDRTSDELFGAKFPLFSPDDVISRLGETPAGDGTLWDGRTPALSARPALKVAAIFACLSAIT